MATTETRKSSREPQAASRARSRGRIREPNMSMAAMNAAALRTARPSSGRPSFTFSRTGSTVRSTTMARSWTMSIPIITLADRVPRTPCSQGLEHYRGARERDQGPQPHRLDPPQIQQEAAHPVTEGDGEHHLDWGAQQGDAPHGCELPQGEVQPDREQEKGHPNLCQ